MKKYAFIFPGQGAQYTGMGRDFFETFDVAREVFHIADETLEKDVSTICFEGSAEDLKQTINTQSAILAVEIAILKVFLEKTDILPSFVAGHSLGEYAALFASGAIDIAGIFPAIQKRADLMHEATISNKGTMMAILGLDSDIIKENLCDGCFIANYNELNQTVITGDVEAVNKTGEILKEKGARRVVPLTVSGAFHSPLMQAASDKFREFAKNIYIVDSIIPVITNVDAEITTKSEDIRDKMSKQIVSGVRWYQTIQKMIEEGVDTFIEMGPGKVLTGLNRKICPENVKTYNISDIESLNSVLEILK